MTKRFLNIIGQMMKELPNKYWDVEPLKSVASRLARNKHTELVDRIQKIGNDSTDDKIIERAENLLQELQEKREKTWRYGKITGRYN